MKQYKFTVVVRSPMDIKDIIWAFTHKLKDAFTVVSLDFTEIDPRPTSTEHHGGDLDSLDDYNNIPERY